VLTLPENWRVIRGGAVFMEILRQTPEGKSQRAAGRSTVAACLHLAAAGMSKKSPPPVTVKSLSESSWQIGDYPYLYIHDIDNRALAQVTELGASYLGSIIVPPRHDELLWRACLQVLGGESPSIIPLDTFVDLRALFSSPDFGWSRERVVLDLLQRYNQHVIDATGDTALSVEIPPA
jgi:hypothetical protein